MTTLIEQTKDFSLENNFDDHVNLLTKRPFDLAVKKEADNLRPFFSAMAEYVSDFPIDYKKEQTSLRFSSEPTKALKRHFRKNKALNASAAQIEHAFIAIAHQNSSLVLSDMPITTMDSFRAFANMHEQLGFFYNGRATSAFPGAKHVASFGGWGFAQMWRPDSETRITIPVLGLTSRIKFDELRIDNGALIRLIESIGRICNHDWLHHMTITKVNDAVAYADKHGNFGQNVENALSRVPQLNNKGTEAYEAFCMKTHAALLKTETAKPLWKNLDDQVNELSERLNENFASLRGLKGDKTPDYKGLHHLAITTARLLRRVEPIESPLTQSFLKSVLNMATRGNSAARAARNEVWETSAMQWAPYARQAAKTLKDQYEKTGLFTDIFKENAFTRANQENATELAASLQLGFPLSKQKQKQQCAHNAALAYV